ncbi:branched-chain amino acid ABC transporter ATP-binding protein/permease [Kineosporia succinea]|uniref:Branched-chain amino acid transport system permease protein n=1 Tax=Kineosporia succinea TaxID=84632 RepID=A0ABT9PAK8_9ACTN|nr:branched-chain amino acid ABC transporter ATP-binding protein/permease [Kineosporia succinea]MDP9829721.1 branched-chain amino acid transport system permease protein [Kineosporia succinea]
MKRTALVITGLAALLLLLLPYTLGPYAMHVADVTVLFALLAIGLGLAMGIAGQINLAQVAFFGIGAYTVAILTTEHGYGFWVSAVLGVLATVLFGLVVGLPALRVQSHYLGIVTLGLALAFTSWVTNSSITGGAEGIPGIPAPSFPGVDLYDQYLYYYLEIGVFAAGLAFALFLVGTRLGRRMKAMRDDSIAAGCLGVNVPFLRLLAFGVASVYGGVAGVLYAGLIHYVSPESFSIATMFLLLAMVIIGGRQSVWGCVIGAVVLALIREWLVDAATYAQLGYGTVVVLAVVFAPTGLAGLPARLPWFRSHPDRATLRPLALQTVDDALSRPGASVGISEVSKNFRGLQALDRVSLSVAPGSIRGVVGPNGSGKTTLLNVLSGLYVPSSGRFTMDDDDLTASSAARLSHRGVARTFQNLRLFSALTVQQNVMVALDRSRSVSVMAYLLAPWRVLGDERRLRRRSAEILTEFGIAEYAQERPSALPYGIQRRVELARAIAGDPRVLLLDEPAAGLNGQEVSELASIVRAIRDTGVTVILVEHNMGLVMSLCDQVTVMAQGTVIADGPPARVVTEPEVVEAYLGDLVPDPDGGLTT